MDYIIMATNDELHSDKKMLLKNNSSSSNNVLKVMEEYGIHKLQNSKNSTSLNSLLFDDSIKKMTAQGNIEEKNPISPTQPTVEVDHNGLKRPANHEISPETKRIKLEESEGLTVAETAVCSTVINIPVTAVHPPEAPTKTNEIKTTTITSTIQEEKVKNCINSVPRTTEEPKAHQEEKNKEAQSSGQMDQKALSHASTVTSSSSNSSNCSAISMAAVCTAPSNSNSSSSATASPTVAVSSAPATPGPQAPPSSEPPSKSTRMSHLKMKYSTELEYMLREFRKLERQLLGAKSSGAGIEESAGSRERREKLHSFILHLEDTIRQVDVGCGLEAEGKSTITAATTGKTDTGEPNSAAPVTSTKQEEEDNVQKLEEHILANLLPVKVRLIKQLAAQQGATKNPIGMPVARRGLQPPAAAHTGTGTFAAAAEERRKQAKAAQEEAEQESLSTKTPSTPSQFGNPLGGNGSSLTQKLHGATLGSEQRRHGDGVGSNVPASPSPAPVDDTEVPVPDPKRKVLYGGMAPGSKQIKSGVSAATGAHKMILESSDLKATAKGPPSKLEAQPAGNKIPVSSIADQPVSSHVVKKVTHTFNSVGPKGRLKPHEDPNLSIEERRKLRKERRKRKKARDLRRREKERQRQLMLQQQASQTSQPKGHGKKVGKSGGPKGGGKKKGPRSVEYICALCSEVYSSTCDYNPWWALASHECPKCRKNQIPRIDITAVANQIEYHPALLAHAEEGSGGGGGMASSTPPVPPMSAIHHVNASHAAAKGYHNPTLIQNPKLSCYPASDSEDESDLSELSDAGDLSDASLDDDGVDDDTPLTDGELAELELFGKEYEGPKLTPDHASRLLVLMGHAQTCPGRHKSVKHRDCCNSVKYLMMHARDCPGTTSTFDVCPYPWCRKVKHLMYHLVACPRPKDCAICSPIALSSNLQGLIGLNDHRRKKHKERMKAAMAAAAKAKPPPPKAPFVPKNVKPTAYRPHANQKKPTTVVNRTAKNSNVRPVPVATSRVTQIPRSGIKVGLVAPKAGSKGTNGVVVKSLVKPVGKSSMVVVNGRSQRPGQPKPIVNTIQRSSLAKPTVSAIPELTGKKPTVAALPGVEALDPSFPEKVSSIPGSNELPVPPIIATAPVPTLDTQDQSNGEILRQESEAIKPCGTAQTAIPVHAIDQAAELNIDKASRPGASKNIEESSVHKPLIAATLQSDAGSVTKNATNNPASCASLGVNAVVQTARGEIEASATTGVVQSTVAHYPPVVTNTQSETGSVNKNPVSETITAHNQDATVAVKEMAALEAMKSVEETPTKSLHPYQIAMHTANGDASMHIADNSVPQTPLTVQAIEQAAEVTANEIRVIHNIQNAASNESVLRQPQTAINGNSETGSIANTVTTNPLPQAAPMVNVPKETVKVEVKELIPMGVTNGLRENTEHQPPVVANIQSNIGSDAKNDTEYSVPQAASIANASEQTTRIEVKELIPMGKLNDVEGNITHQPPVVANVQSITGSNAKNITDHSVPQVASIVNAPAQTAKVEVKELIPMGKLNDVGGSITHQPPVVANMKSNTGSDAKNVTDYSVPQAASIVNVSKHTARVEVRELIPTENKEIVAYQQPSVELVSPRGSELVMKNAPDHPAPKAALAVNALEQAAMKVSATDGMRKTAQVAVSKETAIHPPSVAVNASNTLPLSAPTNGPAVPSPINCRPLPTTHVPPGSDPAPQAALAVNALEQAAKVAMEVSTNGMSKPVKAAVVAINANHSLPLPGPINTPAIPSSGSESAATSASSSKENPETDSMPAPIRPSQAHGEISSNLPPPRFPEVPMVVKEETEDEAKKEVPPV